MEKKLKIGVFGGGRGRSLVRTLWNHPRAELVAVCEASPAMTEKVKAAAEEYNGNMPAFYTDFEEFLKHDMDAVILANYAHEHATYAIRCMEAGLHVLSEVLPMATIGQGVALIEAVERTGMVYAYAENYCYMANSFEMWRRIRAGELGKITYAEGEYVHDCTKNLPSISRGRRDHWRLQSPSAFYCTHSVGPMLAAIGERPVRVVGFELPNDGRGGELPCFRGNGAIEMITLESGAVCRSLHGWLRRQGANNYNYMFYGEKGMIENSRFEDRSNISFYREGDAYCSGEWEKYVSEPFIETDLSSDTVQATAHGGSDYYALYFFFERILGNKEAEAWSIDVYQAVEMGMCGLLAHRSILNGNTPQEIPNLRDPAQRDAWRNDHETTFPDVEGGQLVPITSFDFPKKPDEEFYDHLKRLNAAGLPLTCYPPSYEKPEPKE